MPQKEFEKELISIEHTVESLVRIVENIRKINEKSQLIFTISPVRHLKDGFIENQRSKAHLITAVNEMVSYEVKNNVLNYFPAYELMMDELRDYRFYKKDMMHPSQLAIDYIWEKFKQVWINEESFKIIDKVDEIQKGLNHKPFNANSTQHQKFLKSIQEKITYIQKEYPFMEFN